MSQGHGDFVTRAELQEFQQKVEDQMQAFMAEVRAQSSAFMAEVSGGVEKVGREAREHRAEILDSNRSIGEQLRVAIQNGDRNTADSERTKNQYDRAANALAARVGNLEKGMDRIEAALARVELVVTKSTSRPEVPVKRKPRGGKNA